MICFPNIKINLGLRVINRRTDGFHTIESIFYPVNFCDILELVVEKNAPRGTVIFTSTGLTINGKPEDNLIIQAYQLLHAEMNLAGVRVHLHKTIPMGAGLGGGSSDAACMIKLLNTCFELGLSTTAMESFAAQLGSDCAFFIENKPSYLLGKGPELEPYTLDLKGFFMVLLYANIHSSTAQAYQQVNRREIIPEGESLKDLIQLPVDLWQQQIQNDFEPAIFKVHPQLEAIKKSLYAAGAVYAAMSGSGSAMYGLFKQKPQLMEELRPLVVYEDWL
jgi:4-diphosphocytidyl-2-C-methyl-D-erythritol kinase